MYFLFSLTALSLWSTGCEQRPELGKSVEFTSQSTTTIIEKTITEDSDVVQDKSDKNENVKSDKNEKTVNVDQESLSQETDPFEKETFQLDSSQMGQENAEVIEVEIKSEATTPNLETVDVSSLELVGVWPVQVIGILSETFPKRAVLRRANGSEISVQAGQFISEERLVVLAIGQNHVSLAKVHPDGNVTKIQQMDLQPLD